MKIIKKANLEKIKWKHEYTCGRCTSLIEVELDDLVTTPASSDGPYYQREQKTFPCPVCKTTIYVPSKDIPENSI